MSFPPLPKTSLLKIPRQKRSIAVVHAILDAAIRILTEEGRDGFTTNHVAEVAGISVGSLYQYFGNKETLLAGVVERGVLDAEDIIRDAVSIESDELEPALRRLFESLLIAFEPHGELLGEIFEILPPLSNHSLLTVLETRLMDAARDFHVRHANRYRVEHGAAALYVSINGAIYVFLKWLSERPRFVSRDELIDVLVLQLTAAVRRVD